MVSFRKKTLNAVMDELAEAMNKHFMSEYAHSMEFENLVTQYANYRAQADSTIVLTAGRPRETVEQLEQCVENLADYIHQAFLNSNGYKYCDAVALSKQINTDEVLVKTTLRKFLDKLINDGFLAYFLDMLCKKHYIFLIQYFNNTFHTTMPEGEIMKINNEQRGFLFDFYEKNKAELYNEMMGRCIKIIIIAMPELVLEDIIAGHKVEIVYGNLSIILKAHNLNANREIIIKNVHVGGNVLISIT